MGTIETRTKDKEATNGSSGPVLTHDTSDMIKNAIIKKHMI